MLILIGCGLIINRRSFCANVSSHFPARRGHISTNIIMLIKLIHAFEGYHSVCVVGERVLDIVSIGLIALSRFLRQN